MVRGLHIVVILGFACYSGAVFAGDHEPMKTQNALQDIVKIAHEYLTASSDQRVKLEQKLRSYKGPIEPVINELKPSSWNAPIV
jgi:hypothetical protein